MSTECLVCGCSEEFNSEKEVVCRCDTCKTGCKKVLPSYINKSPFYFDNNYMNQFIPFVTGVICTLKYEPKLYLKSIHNSNCSNTLNSLFGGQSSYIVNHDLNYADVRFDKYKSNSKQTILEWLVYTKWLEFCQIYYKNIMEDEIKKTSNYDDYESTLFESHRLTFLWDEEQFIINLPKVQNTIFNQEKLLHSIWQNLDLKYILETSYETVEKFTNESKVKKHCLSSLNSSNIQYLLNSPYIENNIFSELKHKPKVTSLLVVVISFV